MRAHMYAARYDACGALRARLIGARVCARERDNIFAANDCAAASARQAGHSSAADHVAIRLSAVVNRWIDYWPRRPAGASVGPACYLCSTRNEASTQIVFGGYILYLVFSLVLFCRCGMWVRTIRLNSHRFGAPQCTTIVHAPRMQAMRRGADFGSRAEGGS